MKKLVIVRCEACDEDGTLDAVFEHSPELMDAIEEWNRYFERFDWSGADDPRPASDWLEEHGFKAIPFVLELVRW